MTYVYYYNTKSKALFGVGKPLYEYGYYQLASLHEVIKQNWASAIDNGRTFVLAEGEFLYSNGFYTNINQ